MPAGINVQIADIQLGNTFLILLILGAFTKPIITLNTTTLKSGESLQINCSAEKLDETASFLYEIQVNGTTVANDTKSFVHTIQSVKSTEAGNYSCQVSLISVRGNIDVSNEEVLSGKSTFFFLYSVLSSFCMMETLTLNGLTHFSLVLYFM